MSRPRRKTIIVPDKPAEKPQTGPMFAWTGGGEGELRDVSKPIAFDEGRPLYAPRGFMLRLPWR